MNVLAIAECVLILSSVVGCTPLGPNRTMSTSDPVDRFHNLVNQKEYYQAYLLLPEVRKALDGEQERIAGLEYARLLNAASAVGQKEWVTILESPRIPIDEKLDLVKEIDESAHRFNHPGTGQ